MEKAVSKRTKSIVYVIDTSPFLWYNVGVVRGGFFKMKLSKSTRTLFVALIAMALFGSLFPIVKMGYKAFSVDTSYIPNVILFAGVRFIVCGGVITAIAKGKGDRLSLDIKKELPLVLGTSFFAIILHYICSYTGLTTADSSVASMLKQLGLFLFIPFSFLFFKEDKFSLNKLMGAVCGFAGIFALSYTPSAGFHMGLGEILIIAASMFSVISTVLSKRAMRTVPTFSLVGISQLFGGVALFIIGFSLGGRLGGVTPYAIGVFAYMCFASIGGYCIWNSVIKGNDLSHLFIIKFAESVFAAIFGAILLGEDIFKVQYLIALILIVLGIVVSESGKKHND